MQNPNNQSSQGLLEDLLTPITHTWTTFPNQDHELFSSVVNTFNEEYDDSFLASNSSFLQLISSSIQPTFPNLEVPNFPSYEQQTYDQFEYDDHKPSSLVGYPTLVEQQDDHKVIVEQEQKLDQDVFSMGVNGEKKSKSRKVEGQPSKNLMAERRRRKRLNDRLSMLRSIVPRISKMDRTSILGDTIDYLKDLKQKINNFKSKDMEFDSKSLNLIENNNELKMNEAQARNPPKFEIERRNNDTRIQICCSPKPGLLLSTVNTIEALGLDIQQCVISSFGDFTLQASCSEALENRVMTSSEEMKQILYRSAGYGGRGL
ncbi:transcription factor bHLH93-like [Rutidosis leptorrhynchoides]|uniref:transcription factor bHLH93-like n=1 Tax=Rutidosis leptorrhynchoides TaxID=125765 RepID=UPI003A998F5E